MWIGLLFSELADPGHGNSCLFVFPTRAAFKFCKTHMCPEQPTQIAQTDLGPRVQGVLSRSHSRLTKRGSFSCLNVLVSAQNVFG
jgi:hypothetical protein